MAVFNIYGMCILRDVFSFIPQNNHIVQHFLQWSHPVTNFIYTQKPFEKLELKHFGHDGDKMNFKERCIINDYNNTVLDCFEKSSDFFLLDLVTMVHTDVFKEIQVDNSQHYFTYSQVFGDLLDTTELNKTFFSRKKYSRIAALKLLEDVGYEKIIDAYLEWLLEEKKYCQEQIILVENRSVHHWSDGYRIYELHFDFHKQNELLKKCYEYFKEKCPRCHVVKFPCNVYADYYHRWGLSDLHYCIEYYEYLYACIDAIASKEEDSAKIIDNLYETYSKLFMENIWKLMKHGFEVVSNHNLLKGSLRADSIVDFYAPKGTVYYDGINGQGEQGTLGVAANVIPYGQLNCKLFQNGQMFFVKQEKCKRGYAGTGKELCGGWTTMNSTTEVEITQDSVVVRHNGLNKGYQAQIIQVVEDNKRLKGESVVFSVYARVLKCNSQGNGGSIALINADNYNSGIFLLHKSFDNAEWQRIFLATKLPSGEDFHGLTVCLRAIVSPKGDGAVVEYKNPKLEIGTFPTSIE